MWEPISWEWLGLCAYERSLAHQEAAWERRRRGGRDVCLALEHPATITFGRRTGRDDLRVDDAELAHRGIMSHRVERGGFATYHAPGQLVIYPIVGLAERGFGVRTFVWRLEQIMIDVARTAGVVAHRDPRGRGVWTARGKLGAVGIRVRDGVSTHGIALNVDLDLTGYALITPCGVRDLPITSLRREGATVRVADVLPAAEQACRRHFEAAGPRRAEEARI
jgi:lipoyl(octanoyl) transferase